MRVKEKQHARRAKPSKTSSLSILAIAGVEPYQEKPGEEYMNEAQLAHFRRILEAWRNQLRDEVDHRIAHAG